ncbi:unnamed protein product [Lactuca saligna]|uniref:Uncharacterized protein n=1 Tax=Lactuca saligna TaxID=75948 RepID=A0AA36E5B6_LACSI|nr:unnamed protein product [Lactuca saligna]
MKVDIVVDAVTKVVGLQNSLLTKVKAKSSSDSPNFSKLKELLSSLKELILKLGYSPQPSVFLDFFSQNFSSLESNLKSELAPLMKLIHLMPTNAPFVRTRMQWGEKGVGTGVSKCFDTSSLKDSTKGKVFGKVISIKIPTSLPTSMTTSSTTMT